MTALEGRPRDLAEPAQPGATELRVLGVGSVVEDQAGGEAIRARVTAFKRATRQRYVDASVETGLAALHAALHDGQAELLAPPAGGRIGLLLSTPLGPATTRAEYLRSYGQRGEKSASATLFSNCGYNIAGAMLARSQDIRGPVLTFGAGRNWDRDLLDVARRLLVSGRVAAVYAGQIDAGSAVIVGLALGRGGDITLSWQPGAAHGPSPDHPYSIQADGAPAADDLFRRIAALRCRSRVAAPNSST